MGCSDVVIERCLFTSHASYSHPARCLLFFQNFLAVSQTILVKDNHDIMSLLPFCPRRHLSWSPNRPCFCCQVSWAVACLAAAVVSSFLLVILQQEIVFLLFDVVRVAVYTKLRGDCDDSAQKCPGSGGDGSPCCCCQCKISVTGGGGGAAEAAVAAALFCLS
jgi:hypothetical protein